jgi:hypothetical protein
VFALRVVEGTPVHLRITLDPQGEFRRQLATLGQALAPA